MVLIPKEGWLREGHEQGGVLVPATHFFSLLRVLSLLWEAAVEQQQAAAHRARCGYSCQV